MMHRIDSRAVPVFSEFMIVHLHARGSRVEQSQLKCPQSEYHSVLSLIETEKKYQVF